MPAELSSPIPPGLASLCDASPLAEAEPEGLILFIIPGIYIGVRLAVSIEALVVEGRRGTQAMARSWERSAAIGGTPSARCWSARSSPGWSMR